jgi:hypothetical protein
LGGAGEITFLGDGKKVPEVLAADPVHSIHRRVVFLPQYPCWRRTP